jgi:hypothetical protein
MQYERDRSLWSESRCRFYETVTHLASHLPRNIVATVNLGIRLDLKTIAMHARNAEYNPKVCYIL